MAQLAGAVCGAALLVCVGSERRVRQCTVEHDISVAPLQRSCGDSGTQLCKRQSQQCAAFIPTADIHKRGLHSSAPLSPLFPLHPPPLRGSHG